MPEPVVCFSANDWSDIPSSKSHIMRHLAEDRTVLYVDTLGIRQPRATAHDLRRFVEKARRIARGLVQVGDRLWVWSPPAIPFHGSAAARAFNERAVPALLRRVLRQLEIERPILWSYLPNAVDIIERLPAQCVVYHCIDDYAGFADAPTATFLEMERRLVGRADLTVVSAQTLLERHRAHARRVAYLPHVVDDELFRPGRPVPPEVAAPPGPRAVFVGRIGEWVDTELIARTARALPSWSFVLAGPANTAMDALEREPNVHWLGRRAHEEIPAIVGACDVALVPFHVNELAASINPLKVYEYLAVGTPVVSVPLPELERLRGVVTIAEPDGFARAIEAEHAADTPALRAQRRAAVAGRGWGDVAEEILELALAS